MESLGEKLKAARENKDISLDQASADTKISMRYLQALEREDFSCFPGETYIAGFLRNYGSFLELDVDELLSLYRAFKIQEQPIPVDQLLKQPSRSWLKIVIGIIAGLIVLGAIAFWIYLMTRPRNPAPAASAPRSPIEYMMSGEVFEHRFYRGDSVLVASGQDRFRLELHNLGEAATIRTPGGSVIIDLSQDAEIDLDNSGISNLRISAIDYERTNPDMGVLLRFEFISAPFFGSGWESEPMETASIPSQAVSTVILSSLNPYPFVLQTNFQGYCMFRWEVLFERDRQERRQQYFQRTDELNIQAQNGIRIWISNAQAARFNVIGGGRTFPLEIGSAGEVVVADIRWVRAEDNRFHLIVARLEA